MKESAENQGSETRSRRQTKSRDNAAPAASKDPEDVRESSGAQTAERLEETGRALRDDATLMAETMTDAATQIQAYLREQATQRPYVALGTAAGIGFVLGGGLSLRLTSTLLTIGGRLLVTKLWQQAAQNVTAH